MAHESRFPGRSDAPVERLEIAASDKPMSIMRAKEWRHGLVPIVIALMVLVLVTRLAGRKDLMEHILTYPTFLKSAMQASEGRPFDTAALNDALPHSTPTGFQARAMSKVAQSAGLSATSERWLIHGLADRSSGYLSQFELCLLYWNDGQRAKARETCRNTRNSAHYWLNQGYKADQIGDAAGALAFFQIAAVTDPDLVAAWHQLGRALFAAKQFDEAVLAYERVLALDQTTPADVFDSLSLSYLAIGNPTMARDVLERGLLLYPGQRGYYLNMAAAFRAEGNPQTADSWYARMLQRWPTDAQAWAARADIAADAGQFDDAVTYYQEATRQQPQNIEYWLNLASVAGTAERVRVATDAYMTAMALQPENVGILLQAGRFFVKSGQLTAAREAFEQALVLQPENGEASALLSKLIDAK